MTFKEEQGDLFDLPIEYDLAHCISLDCAMGAGIAVEFDKKYPDLKSTLLDVIKRNNLSYPITISSPVRFLSQDDEGIIHNLITKEKYWHKPTYDTIRECIRQLAYQCKEYNAKYLAMPRIGSGLDRLQWNKVREIIKEEFNDLDIEIIVRYL